ncbi:hypothetical protein [Sulfurimonas sp.]|uniref:hypothetical protein n=1 Tax=Sulfurimonas sp. TaxID=2022749 RepID=UPI00262A8AAD|nr:hypothetical protein [Sulfurimonas sp.]
MRNKFLRLTLLLLSSLVIIGCSTSPNPTTDYVQLSHKMSLSKVHQLIVKAGEENGWIMTEFTNHAILAEKIKDQSSKAVTIHFSEDSFHLTPANSDLQSAIEDKLNGEK